MGEHRLIGEDLGVVPDYVRPSLTSLNIAGFKVPQWERLNNGPLFEGKTYDRLSIVTYATHDHPPLRAMWEKLETEARARNGDSLWQMECLARFAGITAKMPQPYSEEIQMALLEGLLRSNSWIAVMMITDLLGSDRRFNVPGAIAGNQLDRAPSRAGLAMAEKPRHRAQGRDGAGAHPCHRAWRERKVKCCFDGLEGAAAPIHTRREIRFVIIESSRYTRLLIKMKILFISISTALAVLLSGCLGLSIGGGKKTTNEHKTETYDVTLGQQLVDLKKAYDNGVISKREYNEQRKKLLKDY